MKAFSAVTIFFAGLIVGHTMGTVYGAALMTSRERKSFTNYEG